MVTVERWVVLFGGEPSTVLYDDEESAQCALETDFTTDDDVTVARVTMTYEKP